MGTPLKIVFAGGGTGGHLFPALNLARAMQNKWNLEIRFFGTKRGIEFKKVPESGFELDLIPVAGFQRKLTFQNLSFPIKLWKSMRISKRILKEFKPHVVIGTGGYVMGPVLRSAVQLGIPIILQEQNSYPGVTTRMLAGKADLIFTAYEESSKYLNNQNIVVSGNPILYSDVKKNKTEILDQFGLSSDLKTIFVFGGSQGAESINKGIANLITTTNIEKSYQMLWQTGSQQYQKYKSYVEERGIEHVKPVPFIENMPEVYSVCEFAVCRAGAMTLSELVAYKVPAILVPYPYAAGDHQYENARALGKKGGVRIVRDDEQLEEMLEKNILELTSSPLQLEKMRKSQNNLNYPDSTAVILDKIRELLIQKKRWPLNN